MSLQERGAGLGLEGGGGAKCLTSFAVILSVVCATESEGRAAGLISFVASLGHSEHRAFICFSLTCLGQIGFFFFYSL